MVIGGVVVLAAVDYVKTLMSRVSPGVPSVPASGLLLSTLAALVRFPEVVVSADAVGEARVLPSGDVTFMMTDIEGSTRMFRELGDAYVDILETHNSLLRSAVAARGGVEVGTEGDSLLVAFSDPLDAVAACLESQLALAAHSWPPLVDVRVRMGVHTGEAHPVGHDYVALPLHQVARISAAAHGGQILVSQTTADLTRARLPEAAELVDLGAFQLRGFPAPERLFQLNHAGLRTDFPPLRAMGVVSHNLPFHRNSFVGRSEERRALSGLLRTAGVLTLVGSGGVGKTRLAIQVAFDVMERFADGAWLVELAPLTSSDSVIRAVAAAIDVAEEPRRSIEDIVIEALADKSVLLVTEVDGETLVLRAEGPFDLTGPRRIVEVNIPSLDGLSAIGGATVSGSGSADAFSLEADGGSDVDLSGFEVSEAELSVSGGAQVWLAVASRAIGSVTGGASVEFLGEPDTEELTVNGGGQIEKG